MLASSLGGGFVGFALVAHGAAGLKAANWRLTLASGLGGVWLRLRSGASFKVCVWGGAVNEKGAPTGMANLVAVFLWGVR